MKTSNEHNHIVSGTVVKMNNKEYIVCDISYVTMQCKLMDRQTGLISDYWYAMEQLVPIDNLL